jgi:beta-glucosidase
MKILSGKYTPAEGRNRGIPMDTYHDNNKSIEDRVKDLLSRMTLEEKIAQLGSITPTPLLEGSIFSVSKASNSIKHGIGQISAAARFSGLAAKELASLNNDIQRYLVENTRLGIPAIIHEECLNGFRAKGATIFPQNIGLASTWEPELINKITGVIRQQMRATGIHQGLAPVVDIARDPRWGRVEETFGEDPYLDARMAVAYVKGLQGEDIRQGVVATLKHFAGHGLPERGLNCAPSHIPPRLLREIYLYPFEQAVKEGGVLSVMNAYHEIDGVPCAASEELLTEILRKEWGFDGIVVSDYNSIRQLMTIHQIAFDRGEAAALALKAGVDIELPNFDCYAMPLQEQVEKGKVPLALVDWAASRVLTMKFRLGLFDTPYVKPEIAARLFDTRENRELALEAARKSAVLLKNEAGILPLKKDIKTIAIIGPSADSQRNLMGDYTFPSNYGYQYEKDEDGQVISIKWIDEDYRGDRVVSPTVISLLEGIKSKVNKNTRILYAKGCEVNSTSEEGFNEAIKAAKTADVAVVVVGGKSGLLPECTCGELRDRVELGLPGVQEKLVKAVYETGTPLVLVLVNGRPYTLKRFTESIPAIIEAWLPGEEGGNALADVLFGDYNPGGKLPVSFLEKEGQIPVYYAHKPSGNKAPVWGDYVDGSARPLFEFGYGLSYTTFEFSGLVISPTRIPINGEVVIKMDIKNTGEWAGDEVVQLYINDVFASITRPVKELKGFKRIHLKPGEKKTVTFRVPADQLAFYNKNMERKVEPGVFKVMIGCSSDDILLESEFEVAC